MKKKYNYAKTGSQINMIFRGFAAKATTNIVLKFGDSRPNGKGVTGGQFEKIEKKV